MRYAIISDIHSNLESLRTFFKITKNLRINKLICLGDLVGYNPNPNECVKFISSIINLEIIRGNHDRAVVYSDYLDFSDYAKEAVKWTIKTLAVESMNYLKSLVMGPKIIDNTFAICHGSLVDEDNYLLSKHYTVEDFNWLIKNNMRLSFFGHTHYQTAFSLDGEGSINTIKDSTIMLEKDKYYLVNPGSIGQPRDNNPMAGFAVYDTETSRIDIIRYEYPINITQNKILKNHLPEFLAFRLELGK